MIGRTISHYKILEKLGEGGMGVVYRAEDQKLERQVALKFLSPHLLSEDEVRERFVREAKAAASLDHPNISTVYEIDEAEGQTFIAMQVVEGESLDEKIRRGPLRLADALRIAGKVAQALKAAHAKGVVHPDVKPQNVMAGEDDRVTLMDFGLAHLADRSRITKANTSLGTVAYMSPEQAEGRQVDHRADIWALGCVLYEMVAGQRPFLGEFDQAVLYSVLNEQPEPLTAIRTDVPVALELVVDKCLAKAPEERYQSAAELAVDLLSLERKLASGTRVAVSRAARSVAVETGAPQPSKTPRAWLPWAVAAVFAVGMAWVAAEGPGAAERKVYRFSIPPPDGTVIKTFEVSPDGMSLAFVAEEEGAVRLWVRRFDEASPKPVRGAVALDPLGVPFWSPDSRLIGYFASGKLMKVGVAGEPPVELAEAGFGRGGSWNADGSIVFAPHNNGPKSRLRVVSAQGGDDAQVSFSDTDNSHRLPQFLPDGKRFLFLLRRNQVDMEIAVGTLASPETSSLLPAGSHGTFYAPRLGAGPGFLLTVREGVLLAYRFDAHSAKITADGFPVAEGIGTDPLINRGLFSVSGGVLAHASQNAPGEEMKITWVDRRGRELESVGPAGNYWSVRASPDGERALLVTNDLAASLELEAIDLANGNRTELLNAFVFYARWSTDGREVIAAAPEQDRILVIRIPMVGSGQPETMLELDGGRPLDITPDFSWLVRIASQGRGILALPLSPLDSEPVALVDEETRIVSARISPDGAYVAYAAGEIGAEMVHVRGMPRTAVRFDATVGPGTHPAWRADGRELYYLSPQGELVAVSVEPSGRGLTVGPPERLFGLPLLASNQPLLFPYDPALDGQRFLILRLQEETVPTPVQVVVNWDVELEQLAAKRQK